MEQKIKLQHPAGKKALSMDASKYNALKKSILNHLKATGEATHAELLEAITDDFRKHKVKFADSVEWHMEWVKLDLEANKAIKRVGAKPPIKFAIV